MNRIKMLVMCLVGLCVSLQAAFAGSEVAFPQDWRNWQAVSTPLASIGALPGCDADVSSLPPIYQETVEIYCAVRPQGPGAVGILVKPASISGYKSRAGGMSDGPNMILHLQELQLLLVTGYQNGEATYGVFKEDGTDVTAADVDSPLGANTCRVCHSGYAAFCNQGQCGSLK